MCIHDYFLYSSLWHRNIIVLNVLMREIVRSSNILDWLETMMTFKQFKNLIRDDLLVDFQRDLNHITVILFEIFQLETFHRICWAVVNIRKQKLLKSQWLNKYKKRKDFDHVSPSIAGTHYAIALLFMVIFDITSVNIWEEIIEALCTDLNRSNTVTRSKQV